MEIIIANDFTDSPGGRYIKEGQFSGEAFRDQLLVPKYENCKKNNQKLLIDFDGTYGYATSFLDEAFGGLSRMFKKDNILDVIEFKSDDQPGLIADIIEYMKK